MSSDKSGEISSDGIDWRLLAEMHLNERDEVRCLAFAYRKVHTGKFVFPVSIREYATRDHSGVWVRSAKIDYGKLVLTAPVLVRDLLLVIPMMEVLSKIYYGYAPRIGWDYESEEEEEMAVLGAVHDHFIRSNAESFSDSLETSKRLLSRYIKDGIDPHVESYFARRASQEKNTS